MSTNEKTRGARKVRKGTVTSKMGTKSVVVKVEYRELHPVYGKVVIRSKKYHVHDEADTAKVGDTVTATVTGSLNGSSVTYTKDLEVMVLPEEVLSPIADVRASAAQGLGTCILGWLDDEKIRAVCGTNAATRLVITLGYAAEGDKLRAKKRKELSGLVTFLD